MSDTHRLAQRSSETMARALPETLKVVDVVALLMKMADESGLFVDGRLRNYVNDKKDMSVIAVRNEYVEDFLRQCEKEQIPSMNIHLKKDGMKNFTTFAVKSADLDKAVSIQKDIYGKDGFKLSNEEARKRWEGKAAVKVDNLSYKEARILQGELASMEKESLLVANETEKDDNSGNPTYYIVTPKDDIKIQPGESNESYDMSVLDKAILMMELKMVSDFGVPERRHIENEWNLEEALNDLMSGKLDDHVFYDAANPKSRIEITRLDDGNICAEMKRSLNGNMRSYETLTLDPENQVEREAFENAICDEIKYYAAATQMTREDFEKNESRPKILYREDSDCHHMIHINDDLEKNKQQIEKTIQLKMGFNTEHHAVNFINKDITLDTFACDEIKKDLADMIREGKESALLARISSNTKKLKCMTGKAENYILKSTENIEVEIPEESHDIEQDKKQYRDNYQDRHDAYHVEDDYEGIIESLPKPSGYTMEDFDIDEDEFDFDDQL